MLSNFVHIMAHTDLDNEGMVPALPTVRGYPGATQLPRGLKGFAHT